MRLRPALLIAAFTVATLSSCTREYTCTCNISYSGQPGLPDTVTKEFPIRDTKKKAKTLCEQNSEKSTKNGITTVEDCKIY